MQTNFFQKKQNYKLNARGVRLAIYIYTCGEEIYLKYGAQFMVQSK